MAQKGLARSDHFTLSLYSLLPEQLKIMINKRAMQLFKFLSWLLLGRGRTKDPELVPLWTQQQAAQTLLRILVSSAPAAIGKCICFPAPSVESGKPGGTLQGGWPGHRLSGWHYLNTEWYWEGMSCSILFICCRTRWSTCSSHAGSSWACPCTTYGEVHWIVESYQKKPSWW